MSFFYDLRQAAGRNLVPGVTLRPVWGERLMLVRVEMEPHSEVPRHRHPHEQGGIVLEGEMEFTIGEERRRVGPGDAYLIPSNVEHSVRVGDRPTVVLDVFSPPREEYKGT